MNPAHDSVCCVVDDKGEGREGGEGEERSRGERTESKERGRMGQLHLNMQQ